MTSPEVTGRCDRKSMKTLYLGQNHVLFDLISKGTYLHAGHVRRPGDVTPLSLIHEEKKRRLPFG